MKLVTQEVQGTKREGWCRRFISQESSEFLSLPHRVKLVPVVFPAPPEPVVLP